MEATFKTIHSCWTETKSGHKTRKPPKHPPTDLKTSSFGRSVCPSDENRSFATKAKKRNTNHFFIHACRRILCLVNRLKCIFLYHYHYRYHYLYPSTIIIIVVVVVFVFPLKDLAAFAPFSFQPEKR